jgi:hypothetical protein
MCFYCNKRLTWRKRLSVPPECEICSTGSRIADGGWRSNARNTELLTLDERQSVCGAPAIRGSPSGENN